MTSVYTLSRRSSGVTDSSDTPKRPQSVRRSHSSVSRPREQWSQGASGTGVPARA